MARYVIGDIQGCYNSLIELINKISFNPSIDKIYLVGDLVNRGKQSLEVLQWIYKHQDSIITVLGNHDIFLLCRYYGVIHEASNETIGDVIYYYDSQKLLDYLRCASLMHIDNDFILVHAGVYPLFKLDDIIELNQIFHESLSGANFTKFLRGIYSNKPLLLTDATTEALKMKFFINTATRMRTLNKENLSLNYKYKGALDTIPETQIPWFKVAKETTIRNKKIIFGHWASLGFYEDANVLALDTGCVWGRKLTAYNLDTSEIISVQSKTKFK